MLEKTKENFEYEVKKYAEENVIKKLEKQGLDYIELDNDSFNDLVVDEIEILKSDSKKVGTGIVVGLVISAVTGI